MEFCIASYIFFAILVFNVDMNCPICHNSGRPIYCSHCMNTSPNLLVRLRIDLFLLRDMNSKLKNQVERILEYGLKRVEQQGRSESRKSPSEQSKNSEGGVLGKRLLKLDLLRLRKKNNRLRYRISQEQSRITDKKRTKEQIQEQLQLSSGQKARQDNNEAFSEYESIIEETKLQIAQVQKIVTGMQTLKLKNLIEWFVVRKRDSYEFPYSLAFQPLVSLKNFYKLPTIVAWNSISKMSQYIVLVAKILQFALPFKLGDPSPNFLVDFDDHEEPTINDNGIAEYIAKLVINLLQLSRHLNLLSQEPLDLVWLLDQYDLDTLFYNLISNQIMKARPISHHWTYDRVLAIVSEALQLSIYASSPASRPTLSGTMANNTDKWYLVG